MKPKRIILVRHGESEGNVCRAVYGEKPDYALLLTPDGEAQAIQAGQQLRELSAMSRYNFTCRRCGAPA